MDNLKHSLDEERAAPEILAFIQSFSQYVYKSNKSREAEHHSDSLWVPKWAGDFFWEKLSSLQECASKSSTQPGGSSTSFIRQKPTSSSAIGMSATWQMPRETTQWLHQVQGDVQK